MNEGAFGKAIVPEPYTVLGIKLRPFSLGHLFLMRRFGCGFAEDGDNVSVGIGDLILGVAICSRSYEEFLADLDSGELEKFVAEWGKEVQKQIESDEHFNPVRRFALFHQYMKEGAQMPKFFIERDTKGESGLHWSHQILSILISECGYSRTEALNAPLTQCLNDFCAYAERQGTITLMKDWELEAIGAT